MPFDLLEIERLVGGKLGVFDVACPACGLLRRSAHNRTRKVLRVWRLDDGFATYHCARCDLAGHTRPAMRGWGGHATAAARYGSGAHQRTGKAGRPARSQMTSRAGTKAAARVPSAVRGASLPPFGGVRILGEWKSRCFAQGPALGLACGLA